MKNVVFVIESLQCGGAEKSLTTLLQNINLTNLNVDLILFNKGGEFEKFVPKSINVHYKKYFKSSNKINKFKKRVFFFIASKLLKNKNYHPAQIFWKIYESLINEDNKKYDIAIAYNQGFATYYVAKKIKSNIKYAWLNTDYKKAGYNIGFDYNLYNNFNEIICVSSECEISFLGEVQKTNKNLKTSVIKDISDEKLIAIMSLENDGLNFVDSKNHIKLLTVGRLAKAKGYDLAIGACKILVDSGKKIKWFVIGDGPEKNNINDLIKANNLQDNFILLGYNENPYPFIKTCDVYVQTSLFEGLGLTVIEAAILKKPIVTTNFPTAHTIIKNLETGLICEMNSKAIAKDITRLLENSELRNSFVNNLNKKPNTSKADSLNKIKLLLNKSIDEN
ncbi:glycosyltransferase [Mariniflexile jejuense]|uniref:Glycosyltransferase n=1 Tax=Mariniflexile jejuense TaxID=1173582 RepID=A0ABW3JE85_9FLAO